MEAAWAGGKEGKEGKDFFAAKLANLPSLAALHLRGLAYSCVSGNWA